jgi:hypothetical protein
MTIAVSFTAASLLGSVAAVEVGAGAGVVMGAVEREAAGVDVVVGVAALVGAGMVAVVVL